MKAREAGKQAHYGKQMRIIGVSRHKESIPYLDNVCVVTICTYVQYSTVRTSTYYGGNQCRVDGVRNNAAFIGPLQSVVIAPVSYKSFKRSAPHSAHPRNDCLWVYAAPSSLFMTEFTQVLALLNWSFKGV